MNDIQHFSLFYLMLTLSIFVMQGNFTAFLGNFQLVLFNKFGITGISSGLILCIPMTISLPL